METVVGLSFLRGFLFNPSQQRDDHGRFGGGGSGVKLTATTKRAFEGEPVNLRGKPSKQDSGALGEQIALAHLKKRHPDAKPMNSAQPNFAVDLLADHSAIEVKSGLVSNGKDAQKWRATIGEPGKAEKAFLARASPAVKEKWNQQKQDMIMVRKRRVLREASKSAGHKVVGKTVTVLMDTDRKVADVFEFDGFHEQIRWNSPQAKAGYKGSYRYG